jgi:hypothetical protein
MILQGTAVSVVQAPRTDAALNILGGLTQPPEPTPLPIQNLLRWQAEFPTICDYISGDQSQ